MMYFNSAQLDFSEMNMLGDFVTDHLHLCGYQASRITLLVVLLFYQLLQYQY